MSVCVARFACDGTGVLESMIDGVWTCRACYDEYVSREA